MEFILSLSKDYIFFARKIIDPKKNYSYARKDAAAFPFRPKIYKEIAIVGIC